ncbi:MAG: cation transporter [Burkholderiales bacterium]|nr:MAG: cation transporter [Burkholderiales bacterium]
MAYKLAALTFESAHILLEGAPHNLDLDKITHDLEHLDDVKDVHHAHLWSLDGRRSMITLHARVSDPALGPAVVARIKARLHDKHGIDHATIEIEHGDCADEDCV